ncbi:hypothetical protein GCM10028772_02910 [Nocardioides ultimimeridianus]
MDENQACAPAAVGLVSYSLGAASVTMKAAREGSLLMRAAAMMDRASRATGGLAFGGDVTHAVNIQAQLAIGEQ